MEEENFAAQHSENAAQETNTSEQTSSGVSASSAQINSRELDFNVSKIFSLSWNNFKKNYALLLMIVIAYIVVRILESFFMEISKNYALPNFIFIILFAVLNILIAIGLIQIFLKITRGLPTKLSEMIGGTKYFWRFVGGSILYGLIVLGGMILLIVPGIIWAYKYSYFSYLIVDKDMKVLDALKESGKITYGFKWKIFFLQLVSFAVIILGLICLGVGVLVSFAIIYLMATYAYRILIGERVYQE